MRPHQAPFSSKWGALGFAVACVAAALVGGAGAVRAQAAKQMADAVRPVLASLPYAGDPQAFVPGTRIHPDFNDARTDPLRGSYTLSSPTVVSPPGFTPDIASVLISWQIDGPLDAPGQAAARTAADSGTPCRLYSSLALVVQPGAFGAGSCLGTGGFPGAGDINFSADPYNGRAVAVVAAGCARVTVSASVLALSPASHGPRNKPEVMEAMRVRADGLARDATTRLAGAASTACPSPPVSAPARPTTNPPPVLAPSPKAVLQPTPSRRVGLNMASKRPARLVPDAQGVIPPSPIPADEIKPAGFRVEILIRRSDRAACQPGDHFDFSVKGRSVGSADLGPTELGACLRAVELPEGVFTVDVSMRATDGSTGRGSIKVTVQDWLVFGLGDSNGSGEGDPDVASRTGSIWTNPRCHRSSSSFEARTALALEQRDDQTSVTFVHLACSGASIREGTMFPYVGIEPAQPPLPAQASEVLRLAQGREIDAVLISMGINDIGFGPLVLFCITWANCPQQTGFKMSPDTTLEAFVSAVLPDPKIFDNPKTMKDPRHKDTLFVRYNELAGALKWAGVKPERVSITQYFDSTHDQSGRFCDPLVGVPNPNLALGPVGWIAALVAQGTRAFDSYGLFDRNEAAWAHDRVLVPLNKTIRAAAQKHGWRVVTGVQEGFAPHGYCSNDPWIVSLTGAFWTQGDVSGALHATTAGNKFTTGLVANQLFRALYPGGKARPPRA